jgi:hypothetical protein
MYLAAETLPAAPEILFHGYARPKLYPKQLAAIFCPERFSIVEASTKSGKTVGCLAWILEQTLKLKDGQNTWWVAPVSGVARIAYRRIKRWLPDGLFASNDTDRTITLGNGAVIWFKSGEKPDNLFGEDVFAFVADECTRMREEAWHALRTTITATRGRGRFIGNVKGRRNWAFKLARKAEAGEPDWAYARITADDAVEAGILAREEIEGAQRDLPKNVFEELYQAVACDDEGNPFGYDFIEACVAPIQPGPPVAWGWDLAKSVDWTVGIALNKAGACCGFHRFQNPWTETTRRIREATGRIIAEVDSTGVGDPVVETLQKGGGNIQGFKFSGPSKQQLMEGLTVGIQKGEVSYPDGPIKAELEAFEYQYTRTGVRYAAPEGFTDDCVDALALAYRCWKQAGKGCGIWV